jgi:hypothetical protein
VSDICGENQWGVQLTPGQPHIAKHDDVCAGAVGEHVNAAVRSGALPHESLTACYLPALSSHLAGYRYRDAGRSAGEWRHARQAGLDHTLHRG